jgi:hypothetical protein
MVSLVLGLLVGCQTMPAAAPVVEKPPEAIRLFGQEIVPDKESITPIVLARIPLGTSFDEAQQILEANGFECRRHDWTAIFAPITPPEVQALEMTPDGKYRKLVPGTLYATLRKDNVGRWGEAYVTVFVKLYPNRAKTHVHEVQVFVGKREHPYQQFFIAHPEIQEPVGRSVEEAQRQMQTWGFKCAKTEAPGTPPYLLCQYYDETLLGGRHVRIKLFYDKDEMVRDSEIERDYEWFECERCMLPDADDSAGRFIGKSALFPVREAVLVTGRATIFLLYCMAQGPTLPHK